jgi:hypothetical protein
LKRIVIAVALSVVVNASAVHAQEARTKPAAASKEDVRIVATTHSEPVGRYGIAATTEFVMSAGRMCGVADRPCILGSGAGLAAHIGISFSRLVYAGLTYALTKQDPGRLYTLATLQQVRGEFRRYIETERDMRPFGVAALGLIGYGDRWGIDSYGLSLSLGGGFEFDLGARSMLLASLSWRVARMSSFIDTSGSARDASWVQFLSIELAVEGH